MEEQKTYDDIGVDEPKDLLEEILFIVNGVSKNIIIFG